MTILETMVKNIIETCEDYRFHYGNDDCCCGCQWEEFCGWLKDVPAGKSVEQAIKILNEKVK